MTATIWASHPMRLSAIAVSALMLAACREEPPRQRVQARNIIVAVDFSGSRSTPALQESKKLLRLVVDGLKPDDRITLLHVEGQGVQPGNGWSATLPHVQDVDSPTATEELEVKAAVDDIGSAVAKLFDAASSLKPRGTDIMSTLSEVSDHVADAGTRQSTLLLMSDMIQDANGVSFEKPNKIPSIDWINEQKPRIPNLGGLCVTVVGADASTVQGVRIREFWEAYFKTAGGTFSIDRYRHSAMSVETLFCDPVD